MNMLSKAQPWKLFLPLAALMIGWGALPPEQPAQDEVRRQLLPLMASRRALLKRGSENLRHQFTPGFKAQHPLVREAPPLLTQGEIFKTQTPSNLAIHGDGWFAVRKRGETAYTRDGRFTFRKGVLCNPEGWQLLGFRPGHSAPGPIRLEIDPRTCLYAGRYTGFRFNEAGELLAESTMTDPVTGQQATSLSDPLYQVALYRPQSPEIHPAHPTLWRAAQATVGRAGGETLGTICPGSLELSNVDFPRHALLFAHVRLNLNPFSSGLEDCQPGDIRLHLKERIRKDAAFRHRCLDQARYAMTPGAREISIEELGPPLEPVFECTSSPTDLAVKGDGYLLLSDGRLCRGGSFRIDPQGRWIDCHSGAALMATSSEGPQELTMGAEAGQLEVGPDGEVSWCLPEQTDPRHSKLAFVQCSKVVEDGAYVRPAPASVVTPADTGSLVLQGELRLPGHDPYTSRLVGWALMDFAGLPPMPNEAPLALPPWNNSPPPPPPPPPPAIPGFSGLQSPISNFPGSGQSAFVNKKFKF